VGAGAARWKVFFSAMLETRVSKSERKIDFDYFFSNEKVSRQRQQILRKNPKRP